MDDLISRAAALDVLVTSPNFHTALTRIEELPAVDAAPVVHGYWKGWTATHWNKRYNDYGDPEYVEHTYYSCSKCRRRTVIRENHCPNCGAKNTESGL